MNASLLNIISGILLWSFATVKHPLHVSTTEINYNAKEKSLELTCRIFTDDFEAVLASNYKQKTDLVNAAAKKAMDPLVAKYLKAHLSIRTNDLSTEFSYLGYEVDKEAVNVYLEVKGINSLQSLSIANTILYDRFDDQMNIVHAEKSGLRRSAKVNFPQRDMQIKF